MRMTIDTDRRQLVVQDGAAIDTMPLYSKQAFELVSAQWLKVGWSQKYSYSFSWLGRPIIQLPEDLVRVQEVIYALKPDVILETGVAHGGSLIFYASLCKILGTGRVIGIDIEIRETNRRAIEGHDLASFITLIEGDSVSEAVLERARSQIRSGDSVLVLLDSCHTKKHVAAELEAYHSIVTPGSYLVATDGVMRDLHDVPGGQSSWAWDNPTAAAVEFAQNHAEFVLEQPPWPYNGSDLSTNITYWPGAWLRRR